MARLGLDSNWLIQQNDGVVSLFHEYSQDEVVWFNPADGNQTAQMQKVIHDDTRLTDEEKCFAHFWSGYFYAHAKGL